jgi:hypothetical protein
VNHQLDIIGQLQQPLQAGNSTLVRVMVQPGNIGIAITVIPTQLFLIVSVVDSAGIFPLQVFN